MPIYSLYILNKAGGLVYHTDVAPGLNRLSANEYLVLAGTLHGVHAIASRLTPARAPATGTSGLLLVETDLFLIHIYQTLSGLKFMVVASPGQFGGRSERLAVAGVSNTTPVLWGGPLVAGTGEQLRQQAQAEVVLRLVHQCYADYVMKNPFYLMDMPVRCELFDVNVEKVLRGH